MSALIFRQSAGASFRILCTLVTEQYRRFLLGTNDVYFIVDSLALFLCTAALAMLVVSVAILTALTKYSIIVLVVALLALSLVHSSLALVVVHNLATVQSSGIIVSVQ